MPDIVNNTVSFKKGLGSDKRIDLQSSYGIPQPLPFDPLSIKKQVLAETELFYADMCRLLTEARYTINPLVADEIHTPRRIKNNIAGGNERPITPEGLALSMNEMFGLLKKLQKSKDTGGMFFAPYRELNEKFLQQMKTEYNLDYNDRNHSLGIYSKPAFISAVDEALLPVKKPIDGISAGAA